MADQSMADATQPTAAMAAVVDHHDDHDGVMEISLDDEAPADHDVAPDVPARPAAKRRRNGQPKGPMHIDTSDPVSMTGAQNKTGVVITGRIRSYIERGTPFGLQPASGPDDFVLLRAGKARRNNTPAQTLARNLCGTVRRLLHRESAWVAYGSPEAVAQRNLAMKSAREGDGGDNDNDKAVLGKMSSVVEAAADTMADPANRAYARTVEVEAQVDMKSQDLCDIDCIRLGSYNGLACYPHLADSVMCALLGDGPLLTSTLAHVKRLQWLPHCCANRLWRGDSAPPGETMTIAPPNGVDFDDDKQMAHVVVGDVKMHTTGLGDNAYGQILNYLIATATHEPNSAVMFCGYNFSPEYVERLTKNKRVALGMVDWHGAGGDKDGNLGHCGAFKKGLLEPENDNEPFVYFRVVDHAYIPGYIGFSKACIVVCAPTLAERVEYADAIRRGAKKYAVVYGHQKIFVWAYELPLDEAQRARFRGRVLLAIVIVDGSANFTKAALNGETRQRNSCTLGFTLYENAKTMYSLLYELLPNVSRRVCSYLPNVPNSYFATIKRWAESGKMENAPFPLDEINIVYVTDEDVSAKSKPAQATA